MWRLRGRSGPGLFKGTALELTWLFTVNSGGVAGGKARDVGVRVKPYGFFKSKMGTVRRF